MTRGIRGLLAAMVVALAATAAPVTAQDPGVPHVLLWTGTFGFRHPSIDTAVAVFSELAAETGAFTVASTADPADLNAETLAGTDVLVWIETTGKPPFSQEQRDAIIRFAGCGGGNMFFHAAQDANYAWPEYAELIGGALFDSHPHTGEARLVVEDGEHPITAPWGGVDSLVHSDEYYRVRAMRGVLGIDRPRAFGDTHVLLSIDEDSLPAEIQDGDRPYEDRQPVAWTKTFRGAGRVYVNNMGHQDATWLAPEYQESVVSSLDWISEVPLDAACFAGDEALPPPPGPPPADPAQVGQACPLPELAPGQQGGSAVSPAETTPAVSLTEAGHETTMPLAPLGGGLSRGTVTYVLDLTASGASAADVVLTMDTLPTEEFDLSVDTPWALYGSQEPMGALSEQVEIAAGPHCAVLQVSNENMGTSPFPGAPDSPTGPMGVGPGNQPLHVTVAPLDASPVGLTRLVAGSDAPVDVAAAWSGARSPAACRCALLARDDDFADALASGAAGALLLLTDTDTLSPGTRAQLRRHEIERVTILGGEQAVSAGVAAELDGIGITVERVAGATRVDTALAMAEAFALTGEPLLVRAFGTESNPTAGFADALAAGRAAALAQRPLLLTAGDALSEQVAAYLTAAVTQRVTVVGGTAAVSDAVLADLAGAGVEAVRVAGPERAATAVAVARALGGADSAAHAGGAILIDGFAATAWADGFVAAGAPQAGPIVLADGATLPAVTAAWLGQASRAVPLTCGALVDGAACAAAAGRLGLQ